jgi:DNA-binding transcriptional ArsR family regulator
MVRGNLPFVMTYATEMLTALGDPSRQAIVDVLSEGPLPVGEIARLLPISRPAVSQHLKVLSDVGLVVSRQVGTRRIYRTDPDALAALREHLDGFWSRAMRSFEHAATTPQAAPQEEQG